MCVALSLTHDCCMAYMLDRSTALRLLRVCCETSTLEWRYWMSTTTLAMERVRGHASDARTITAMHASSYRSNDSTRLIGLSRSCAIVSIFWNDPSVLMISIHADPALDYPFNAGFADQIGGPSAEGATLNIPLRPQLEWSDYRVELQRALDRIKAFGAEAVVLSLGLDPLRGDPVASPQAGLCLDPPDYEHMGKMLQALNLPLVVVQEGGYDLSQVHTAVKYLLIDGLSSSAAV